MAYLLIWTLLKKRQTQIYGMRLKKNDMNVLLDILSFIVDHRGYPSDERNKLLLLLLLLLVVVVVVVVVALLLLLSLILLLLPLLLLLTFIRVPFINTIVLLPINQGC